MFSLTYRQMQVAKCCALGMSDKQIAERLQIKLRTAQKYVERAKQRLGLGPSRKQLAAWANKHWSRFEKVYL